MTNTQLPIHMTHYVSSWTLGLVHALFSEMRSLITHKSVMATSDCYRCFSRLTWNLCTCYMLQTEYLCSPAPKLICWNQICNVMVFGGGAFGEVTRSWGYSPHDGMTVLIKEAPESSLALSVTWGQREHSHLWARRQVLTRHWICQHLDLGLLASRTMRNKGYLF